MKSATTICLKLDNWDNLCVHCGEYNKKQPCKENIPDYIPDEQIRRFLIARRDNV